jgi:ParB-like chromosome segregation protein Spo0J
MALVENIQRHDLDPIEIAVIPTIDEIQLTQNK